MKYFGRLVIYYDTWPNAIKTQSRTISRKTALIILLVGEDECVRDLKKQHRFLTHDVLK